MHKYYSECRTCWRIGKREKKLQEIITCLAFRKYENYSFCYVVLDIVSVLGGYIVKHTVDKKTCRIYEEQYLLFFFMIKSKSFLVGQADRLRSTWWSGIQTLDFRTISTVKGQVRTSKAHCWQFLLLMLTWTIEIRCIWFTENLFPEKVMVHTFTVLSMPMIKYESCHWHYSINPRHGVRLS